MKRILIIATVIFLLLAANVFAGEKLEISEIYFKNDGNTIYRIETGEVSAEAILSSVGDKSGRVTLIMASYDNDKNLLGVAAKITKYEDIDGKAISLR